VRLAACNLRRAAENLIAADGYNAETLAIIIWGLRSVQTDRTPHAAKQPLQIFSYSSGLARNIAKL
jgi:hypothetical protein